MVRVAVLVCFFSTTVLSGQSEWLIPHRTGEIRMDGFLGEWTDQAPLSLTPASTGAVGEFEDGDIAVNLWAAWDKESLYLAIEWQDNVWDIESVSRQNAVWRGPDRRRRERAYFYDYFKFHIRSADYDFIAWISPRIDGEGPFGWHRLLRGYQGMETAAAAPLTTTRQEENRVTMEVRFFWKELRLDGDENDVYPLTLIFSDSDYPGRLLDFKVRHLKRLEWTGRFRLGKEN